jgi:hypothetical protein
VILGLHTVAFAVALAYAPGYSMRYFLPLTVPLSVIVTTGLKHLSSLTAARFGVETVRWTVVGMVFVLVIGWLETFADGLYAFHFRGAFDAVS